MHQQCWLWGQDVRRPEGNLLQARGFDRQRAPQEASSSSQYTCIENGCVIRLWGFGVFFGSNDRTCEHDQYAGIYLNRYEFTPRLALVSQNEWQSFELFKDCPIATDTIRLAGVARWIAGYEAWVIREQGVEYRAACLARWSKRGIPAEEFATRWLRLAEAFADAANMHEAT